MIAFIIARRWCLSLQRHDRELLLHGYETGVIVRSPDGRVLPRSTVPINPTHAYTLTTHDGRSRRSSCHRARTQNGVVGAAGRA